MPHELGSTSPLVIIANPRAGAGRAVRILEGLSRALAAHDVAVDLRATEAPRHATELVRDALAEGATGIAIVGGDGTMSEALAGYLDDEGRPTHPSAWLAPIPAGTGGDFRRTIGLPAGNAELTVQVERLLAARPRPVDVGWLEYRDHGGLSAHAPFLNIASFGLGGRVDEVVNGTPKWLGGRLSFLFGTLRARAGYRKQPVRIIVDDDIVSETPVLNVAVANGRFFGGGMEVAPAAAIDDGLFEVVAQRPASFGAELREGRAIYRGGLAECPDVGYWRGREVRAEPLGNAPVLLDVDGEAPGALPARFSLRAGALLLRA